MRSVAGLLGACAVFSGGTASAQVLNVLPVTIELAAGQRAAALTIINEGDAEASFQLRSFRWTQGEDGSDVLAPSDEISVSPPLGTIAHGASQVVRIVLRQVTPGREGTYRLLLDQIPAPAAPGTVRIALRLSLPVFAPPVARATPDLKFHVERSHDQIFLVAVNHGVRHEKLRDITLKTGDGTVLAVEKNVSPYILAGATRRWHVGSKSMNDPTVQLSARGELNQITDQSVTVTATP
ncbi:MULTISPECIES: fimbrial biogenesis chaperone [Sphingosinicellaceae]|uniref:fimbrial biogenesis chaperone n=1 Tax=Sphingosinicellaceae TaxID=2820280 RepID=UPI001C1E673E|nr:MULTISPECIES: fimbria/pilus periplasmic chaperone [Polymorphobacter]QYE32988.1 fimbria/pilus periplasmic chaperone [Polymorphobacter sp. PAMC 29334]UAJ12248.1 fimbria/pilus periplasmic chaperone [Polymorphobacter megasporae]